MKIGHIFDKEKRTLSAPPNLTWCASYTLNITTTHLKNPVPATQEKLIDG